MMSKVISKRSLAEEVADSLRADIKEGRYHAGDQLPTEPELMKTFGVGRSSIREAVRILSNSGLLKVQQGVGMFIEAYTGISEPFNQRLKRSNTNDLDEVRQLLELKIAEKAAVNHTDADIKNMELQLNKRILATEQGNLTECIQADIDFHISIARACGNEILLDLYQSFTIHLKNTFMELYADTTVFKKTLHLHQNLFESIKSRNSKQAWLCAEKIVNN